MNESLAVVEGRHVLSMERRFDHPVEKVWRAITDPREMGRWFPSQVEIDLRVGGTIRFSADTQGPDMEGRILELDPPRLFTYTWGDSVLRFELVPEDSAGSQDGPEAIGCRMLFRHTFDDPVSGASFAAGWTICFQNLERSLVGKPADVGLESWAALHDSFVGQFGLDAGTAGQPDEPGGDTVVRFARQLTRSVDDVWRVLTAAQPVAVGEPPPGAFTAGMPSKGPTDAAGAAPRVTAVSEAGPTRLLEYTADLGAPVQVRWQLSAGNGGARLDLTETVPATLDDEPRRALAAWADALDNLAVRLRQAE